MPLGVMRRLPASASKLILHTESGCHASSSSGSTEARPVRKTDDLASMQAAGPGRGCSSSSPSGSAAGTLPAPLTAAMCLVKGWSDNPLLLVDAPLLDELFQRFFFAIRSAGDDPSLKFSRCSLRRCSLQIGDGLIIALSISMLAPPQEKCAHRLASSSRARRQSARPARAAASSGSGTGHDGVIIRPLAGSGVIARPW